MFTMGSATQFARDQSRAHRRAGLSLAEAAISTVIVAGVLVAALDLFAATARARVIQTGQVQANALAQQLMTEILRARYQEPEETVSFGRELSESGASRADFDDVDDYDNWSASPPQAKDGTPMVRYDGWTREVSISYTGTSDPKALTLPDDEGLKRITVTVTDPRGDLITLVALRSSASLYDQPPAELTTYVDWVGPRLQIGKDPDSAVETGVNLINRVKVE